MTELQLDPSASKLVVRIRAAGLLARLAHDLEIAATDLSGRARENGETWSAELRVPVAGLRVAGTLRGDTLVPEGLSPSDRAEVERRIRQDVLRGTSVIQVQASGETRDRAHAEASLAAASARTTAPMSTRDLSGGAVSAAGACRLSLAALGIHEIKGPLGAFKVRDDIEVRFELTLRPAG